MHSNEECAYGWETIFVPMDASVARSDKPAVPNYAKYNKMIQIVFKALSAAQMAVDPAAFLRKKQVCAKTNAASLPAIILNSHRNIHWPIKFRSTLSTL